jgi:hypothetical protein
MHQHRHHGRRGFHNRPFPNRQELLTRLEERQRDLEQELADIADVIAHLRDRAEEPQQQEQ